MGIASSHADHRLDLSCLFSFVFTTPEIQDTTVYLDNMRLSAG